MSPITVMMLVMTIMLFIGVPIGAALGISILALIAYEPITTYEYVAQYMYTGIASFTLLSLPFFVICGSIMDVGGLSKKLVMIANSLIGNITGGLGIVTIVACMFFGAISGSANATVAAIGAIMIPQMVRAGYDKYYATGLVAVAGGLGVIVPPSYPMVLYGVSNNVSIGNLFIAGIGPSLLVGGMLILVNYVISRKYGYRGTKEKLSIKRMLLALKEGIWALLMPVIILGGIYGGIFTATEAAVVATVYSLIVGVFIYRELKLRMIWKIFYDNVSMMGGMLYTMAPAAALSAMFIYLGFTDIIRQGLYSISTDLNVIMLIIFVILFIAGMFIQTTPAMVILSPILLSVVQPLGMHPIQFGMIMITALSIAFVTPPVAANLFVATTMTGLRMDRIVKKAIPFIAVLIIAFFIIAYCPAISLMFL